MEDSLLSEIYRSSINIQQQENSRFDQQKFFDLIRKNQKIERISLNTFKNLSESADKLINYFELQDLKIDNTAQS